jgi:bla regulator protein blaR1
MIAYIIKSALSLALLLGVYYLALQREKMHGFKRFYLLFAICFSFIIPFVEIETSREVLVFVELKEFAATITEEPDFTSPVSATAPKPALLPLVPLALWIIYAAGAAIMLYRFIKNLWQLRSMVKRNTAIRLGNARLVLLNHPVAPNSFLNYIFVSKEDYDHAGIEEELLQHELTHIQQKHSLDILLVELLSIVSWFNPIIYFYKKAIKLNHEFLADEAVIRRQKDVSTYQQILLSKIFMNKASGLASHVHYSLTKKRLIMMTKSTSWWRALALQTAMAPLFTVLFLLFCTKMLAQDPQKPPVVEKKIVIPPTKAAGEGKPAVLVNTVAKWKLIKNQDSLRAVKERYYGRNREAIYWWKKADGNPVKKHWHEMTQEEKDDLYPPPPPPVRIQVTQKQLDAWLDPEKYGIWIDEKRVSNDVLSNYTPSDFGHYSISRLYPNATNYGKHVFQLNLMTVPAFLKWRKECMEVLGLDEKQ